MKKTNLIFLISICSSICTAIYANGKDNYLSDFKNMKLEACDNTFHELEDSCSNMVCRDLLVNTWAECWRRSMNAALDKRLIPLRKTDHSEFQTEMLIQKVFNQAIQQQCGKECDEGGTMKGISYNFCRVDAYKYRTIQAMQINMNTLSVPLENNLLPEKRDKEKTKDTHFYKEFTNQLCQMPKSTWSNKKVPGDCEKKAFNELNSFEFTDDVCDLS